MDILLFLTALLILLFAGCGVVLLITSPKYAVSMPELLSLSLLFGVAFVSLTTFGAGLLFSGATLHWIITLACLATGAIGVAMRRRQGTESIYPLPSRVEALLLIGLLIIQAAIVIWWSLNRPLGFDGFAIWDLKARGAYLNGGVVPLSSFYDPTRIWSHPEYPLCLPLTTAWFYGWLGRPDQGLVKLVFPLFYVAALGLLYAGASRLGGQRWQGLLLVVLVFFVPFTRIGDGSAASAYIDFPVAVFYLAAVIYLLDYWKTKAEGALRLLGCLAALLPWVKQEGGILWLCLIALALSQVVRERQLKSLLILVLPGALTLVGWNLFVRLIHAPVGQDFLPFTLASLWSNLGRGPEIVREIGREMTDWHHWSLLWPGLLLALPLFISRSSRKQPVVLLLAVAMPVILYSGIYFFSAWSPFIDHVHTSLSRLLLQVSLVAILIVGLAVPIEIVGLIGSAFHQANPAPAKND